MLFLTPQGAGSYSADASLSSDADLGAMDHHFDVMESLYETS